MPEFDPAKELRHYDRWQLALRIADRQGAAIEATLRQEGFRVAWEQDEALRGTPIRMLYATRA